MVVAEKTKSKFSIFKAQSCSLLSQRKPVVLVVFVIAPTDLIFDS